MDHLAGIRPRTALRTGALLVLALATACASTPAEPPESLQAARQAITAAESADAGHNAPGDLGEARTKLAAANAAVSDKNLVRANRLALESRAAADLAIARTSSIKAQAVNAGMISGNVALAEELDRSTGAPK